jgi:hypothetical protein
VTGNVSQPPLPGTPARTVEARRDHHPCIPDERTSRVVNRRGGTATARYELMPTPEVDARPDQYTVAASAVSAKVAPAPLTPRRSPADRPTSSSAEMSCRYRLRTPGDTFAMRCAPLVERAPKPRRTGRQTKDSRRERLRPCSPPWPASSATSRPRRRADRTAGLVPRPGSGSGSSSFHTRTST